MKIMKVIKMKEMWRLQLMSASRPESHGIEAAVF